MRRRLTSWVLALLVAPLLTATAALAAPRQEPPPRPVDQLTVADSDAASTARLVDEESGEEGEEHEGGGVVVVPGWYPGWYGPGWYGWGPGWWDTPWSTPWHARHLAVRPSKDAAAVELHVHPWKAEVKVDGALVGQARDFDSRANPLWVKPGEHVLELSYPGYQTLRTDIDASSALTLNLRYHLDKGHGLDPRSAPEAS